MNTNSRAANSNYSVAKQPLLAIVIPCFNEEDSLPKTLSLLGAVLGNMKHEKLVHPDSFLYFVDDGSSDATWELLKEAHLENNLNCALKLSRNFGHQNALLAGLLAVKDRCDAAISIDADLQQDHLAIPYFVERYIAGAEIVFGIRTDRSSDSWFKRTTASTFYKAINLMGTSLVPNHADYRLLGRRAIDALSDHHEPNIFLRAICVQLGFKTDTVYFDVQERKEGVSKYSFLKMLALATNGITSFSVFPLRLVSAIGVFTFGGSLLMAAYVSFRFFFVGDTVPGWASTTLPIYFIGGLQLLGIGVIGEYVAQAVIATKARPRFIPERELF